MGACFVAQLVVNDVRATNHGKHTRWLPTESGAIQPDPTWAMKTDLCSEDRNYLLVLGCKLVNSDAVLPILQRTTQLHPELQHSYTAQKENYQCWHSRLQVMAVVE